jgi:hypothetical protein
VFHFGAVLFAFGAATVARLEAGAELRAGQFEIGAGEAGDDSPGGETDVGAIDAVADALDLVGDDLFAESCIGAGVARFRTRVTGRDALDGNGVVR